MHKANSRASDPGWCRLSKGGQRTGFRSRWRALAAAVAVLSGCGGESLPRAPEGGIREAHGPEPVLGIAEPNAWRRTPPAARPEAIAASIAGLGARSQRFVVDWSVVEPRPPAGGRHRYRFGPFDAMYRADLAHGLRPLLVALNAPRWAWDDEAAAAPFANNPPADEHLADWRAFVAALARRYPRALAVEIWNEPNVTAFWGGGSPAVAPDPGRYGRLLGAAHAAVRSVSPRLPVIGGALAANQAGSGAGDVPMAEFAAAMFDAGAAAHMDAISVHPYPGAGGAAQSAALVDQLLEARDDASARVPVWVTEVGVTTTGAPAVDEVEQARRLVAVCQALAAEPAVDAVYIHNLIGGAGPLGGAEPGFGLLAPLAGRRLRPKAAAGAVRAAFAGRCGRGG